MGGKEWREMYRLGGNCFSRRLVRAIGSKDLMCSSEGPPMCIDDCGSTSSESSVMPLKLEAFLLALRHWRP